MLPETAINYNSATIQVLRVEDGPPFRIKGIGLIEVLISLFLISVGILALLSLQPSAWKLTSRSDHLSRAGGLLHKEMETTEIVLMNPNYPNPCAATHPLVPTTNVFISEQSTTQPGDLPFTMQTTIQDNLN